MPLFQNAAFFTTVNHLRDLPDTRAEVAFVGRSNAGKSSAINTLANRTRLAYVSKTPGRTQHINFFDLGHERFLVDLPGYGYAQVPEEMKRKWQESLTEYLQKRESLKGLVILMDIRHPLKDIDRQLLNWAVSNDLEVLVLLTKADKFNPAPRKTIVQQVRRDVVMFGGNVRVEAFSALKGLGIDTLAEVLTGWYLSAEAENAEDADAGPEQA